MSTDLLANATSLFEDYRTSQDNFVKLRSALLPSGHVFRRGRAHRRLASFVSEVDLAC